MVSCFFAVSLTAVVTWWKVVGLTFIRFVYSVFLSSVCFRVMCASSLSNDDGMVMPPTLSSHFASYLPSCCVISIANDVFALCASVSQGFAATVYLGVVLTIEGERLTQLTISCFNQLTLLLAAFFFFSIVSSFSIAISKFNSTVYFSLYVMEHQPRQHGRIAFHR